MGALTHNGPPGASLQRGEDARRVALRIGKRCAGFAREKAGPGGRGHGRWRGDVDLRAGLDRLGLPRAGECQLRGLRGAICAKELVARARVIEK